nr:hypothetical protein Iba_chr10bCG9880 [Ipomoea batatas]
MGNPAFHKYCPKFYTDREASIYWKSITGNSEYNLSNLHAKDIIPSHLKAIRLALAINLSRGTTNLNKAYCQDLFYLWSMEKNEPMNMDIGDGAMSWLGLEERLAREKIEARMELITSAEFLSMGLKKEGDSTTPQVMDWESRELSNFNYITREANTRHGDAIALQRDEIVRAREAVERQGRMIEDLQAQFMSHFGPSSHDDDDQ